MRTSARLLATLKPPTSLWLPTYIALSALLFVSQVPGLTTAATETVYGDKYYGSSVDYHVHSAENEIVVEVRRYDGSRGCVAGTCGATKWRSQFVQDYASCDGTYYYPQVPWRPSQWWFNQMEPAIRSAGYITAYTGTVVVLFKNEYQSNVRPFPYFTQQWAHNLFVQ
jgi:hypothetical protein